MFLYILPACSFTYQQCLKLDKLLGPLLCHAHGIQRNCNKSIIYLSHELGGMEIYSLYHLQGTAKLQFLFKHYREFDTTGKLLTTSMRYTQLELGMSKNFLSLNFYKYANMITPTWVTNLWQYMCECNCQILEVNPWLYNPPREGDFFLMDVIQRSNLPDNHKEIFNRVRLNLRLLTASDIVIASSRSKIIPGLYEGNTGRYSSYNWPKYHTLPSKWQLIFNDAVKQIIVPQLQNNPLGKWREGGYQRFLYKLDHVTNKVCIFNETNSSEAIDIDCHHITRKILGQRIIERHDTTMDISRTPTHAIKTVPVWMSKLWRHRKWTDTELTKIIATLKSDSLHVIGDGSVRDQWGAYAWTMVDSNDFTKICDITHPVDGPPTNMKEIRVEATCILSSLSIIHTLQDFVHSPNVTIHIYTS